MSVVCKITEKDGRDFQIQTELNGQSFEIIGRVCYFSDTIVAVMGGVNSAIARISSGWIGFKSLVTFGNQ